LILQRLEIYAKECIGMPFRGILFTGLMMTKAGPKVLEYNVRFGDPETQTCLPLISEKTDLAKVMLAAAMGHLDSVDIEIQDKFSATVVVAAGGYPGSYAKHKEITVSAVEKGMFCLLLSLGNWV
jgi:phosphoribosylamine--glycine ligase/phosphoribosylformylglycinamidine cyclo-ligase